MKIRTIAVLAVGAAIGYALNTEGGRKQLAKARDAGQQYLGQPKVQAKASDLAEKAKQKAAGLPHPVQSVAHQTINMAQKATHRAAAPDGDTPTTP